MSLQRSGPVLIEDLLHALFGISSSRITLLAKNLIQSDQGWKMASKTLPFRVKNL